MRFDDPNIREAYRRGVTDAYESACIHVPASRRIAVEAWLKDVVDWNDGEPPIAPHRWSEATPFDPPDEAE
jgi:hypothetical protein